VIVVPIAIMIAAPLASLGVVQLFNSVAGGLHGLCFMAAEVVPGVLHFLKRDVQRVNGFMNSGATSHGRRRRLCHHHCGKC
jgi:hypothetical protein